MARKHEQNFYVPPEIVALREKLVADFMTGNTDADVLRKLRDFAASVRGQPRVEVAPRPKRRIIIPRKTVLAPRTIVESVQRPDNRHNNPGRTKGSRFLIVGGKRRLVAMVDIENAIKDGATWPTKNCLPDSPASSAPTTCPPLVTKPSASCESEAI